MSETSHPQVVAGSPVLQAFARAPGAFYLLAIMGIALTIWTPGFFTAANLTNVALQVAVLTIVALGMTLVILTEGIDLSLGPVLGLCGVSAALLVSQGHPLPLAIGAALGIGVCFGLLNGTLVAVAGMPPFIVTLGAFGIAQSVATVLTGGDSVTNLPPFFRWFNDGVFLSLPVPIWATAAVFGATWLLLYRTKFGRYVFAIGGNRRALVLSGTRVQIYHVAVYAYAGLLAGVASFIMTARMNAAHPTIGVGIEFDAIAAVILGGTSFEKGRGGIAGTVVGALAVGVLRNGLNLLGVGTEWQVAIVGIVIISAVGLDSLRRLNA
ncbi:MAG: ABC transporter permease [Bradyrhizobiaceae bacterium]|nr:MAG: ABC transporter permease [Bradyrhizobiaceae bacterium]